MIDCLIVGDSIAVGIGQVSPQCETIAKVGINSKNFVAHHKHLPQAGVTIISLGSNDGAANYSKQLKELRKKIIGKVVWILSANNAKARNTALAIARQNGDGVVYLSSFATTDGVHPKSYSSVAKRIPK